MKIVEISKYRHFINFLNNKLQYLKNYNREREKEYKTKQANLCVFSLRSHSFGRLEDENENFFKSLLHKG